MDVASAEKSTKRIAEIDKKIVEEQRKFNAANDVLKQGQKALEECLTSKNVKKEAAAKANSLIKLAIENSSSSTQRLEDLKRKRQEVEEKNKKRKLK